jgi:hypothetical protein
MTHNTKQDPSAALTTDSLIAALTADLPTRPTSIGRAIAIALAIGVAVAGLALVTGLVSVRPGLLSALQDVRVSFKMAFTLAVALAGSWLALRVLRPGTQSGPATFGLAATALLLAVGIVSEMAVVPMDSWRANVVTAGRFECMVVIPLLSAIPLVALLYMMRAGAPDSPTLAGASAGLIAAGIGATAYSMHCPFDSPLYVAIWYVIGMSIVVAVGALAGSRVLRW